MCGILGCIGENVDDIRFAKMVSTLKNRGPDGTGIARPSPTCILGHTRLAIIDTSEAGRQPFHDQRNGIWTVLNGEIYNHRALRAELEALGHAFHSQCDSEVLLHGYAAWGEKVIPRLRGIFALAVYDARKQTLILARDPAGVKPLYYATSGNQFAFASELKALRMWSDDTLKFDPDCIFTYLAYRYLPAPLTPYRNAFKLEPAHMLTYNSSAINISRFWTPEIRSLPHDEQESIHQLRATFAESVEAQMMADVPVGTLLSGGIDSSAVTVLASGTRRDLQCYCCGFEEASHDERVFARLSAQIAGVHLHETVMNWPRLRSNIADFIDWFDEPFFDYSAVGIFELSQMAKAQGIKVLLTGEGADEMFAGYRWYDTFDTYCRTNPASALEKYFSLMGYFTSDMLSTLAGRTIEFDHLWLLRKHDRPELPPVNRAQWMDFHTFLPDDVLCKDDRASMASGIELRVPFLDNRMLNECFLWHQDNLYRNGERKYLLKQALSTILPENVLTTRKKGFGFPLSAWDRPIRNFAKNIFKNGQLIVHGYAKPTTLEHCLTAMNTDTIWLLLTAELWLRRFIAHENINDLTNSELHNEKKG